MDTIQQRHFSDWPNAIQNRKAIDSLYDEAPLLDGIGLHMLSLSDRCEITLTTRALPVRIPARWRDPFNKVHIELQLVGIENLTLSGWPWERIVSVRIAPSAVGVEIVAEGPSIAFRAECQFVWIGRIVPVMVNESSQFD